MALHDTRVQWIKTVVGVTFDLPHFSCFEELLARGDGEDEQKILHFLNEVTKDEETSTLFFFKNIREVEVEVHEGKLGLNLFTVGVYIKALSPKMQCVLCIL